ncbi:glutamate-gated chloride channel-like isoform X1 [Amblyomma americanum]
MNPQNSKSLFKRVICIATCFVFWEVCHAQNNAASYAARTLNDLLKPEKYDKRLRPAGTNESTGPVVVTTDVYFRSISDIDDKKMEYSVQLTLRQRWKDERLEFNDMSGQLKRINVGDPSRLWLPDPFFVNEVSGRFHLLLKPNALARIHPDGTVLYSVRVTLRLSCPMDFSDFPFDRQTCGLKIESYGHTAEDIVFVWRQGDNVQVARDIHIQQFTATKFLTGYCTTKTTTGEYSCLKVDFTFERHVHEVMIRAYLPCVVLVLLSWVALWINTRSTEVRILVPTVVLLVMDNLVGKMNQDDIPRTSYAKAADAWTALCLIFVLLLLLYVTVTDYVFRVTQSAEKVPNPVSSQVETESSKHTSASSKTSAWHHALWSWAQRSRTTPERMDFVARIVFPAAFLLFVIVYFSVHATASTDETQKTRGEPVILKNR